MSDNPVGEPREYTIEECREMFLDQIDGIVKYWLNEERQPTVKEKLEGVAFSFLVLLDGCNAGHPGMSLIPSFHPGDKEYHRENGDNWWPDEGDIGGGVLHDVWSDRNRRRGT